MSDTQQHTANDRFLVIALKQDDRQAFTRIFRAYYKDLVLFGGTYIPEKSVCEDIVQNIFLKLWNDRKTLEIELSLKAYLLKAVRNYCLDELRHRRIIDEHIAYELKSPSINIDTTENYILYSDLCQQLRNALEQLPPQEREVFEMSRLENIKYQEIADRLNISVRTVEVRISKALKQLRILLKDFYLLFFFFLFH
ncbi:RNA polymerase sigma-70 factor [uncultured Bacteroides sp.]|uniref:RNA polymerase sigma-70 factor n=1 Tax=uncultured Bacteroides sp. TaxID=162156 RepID=UPI002600A08A|nr:RNA polymerase sigma-70 factor [uncultured Bacteroides sp.]